MIYTHFVKVIGFDTRAIQFSSFSLHFREDRDSEIAPTEERLEHQMRTTGQLNGSVLTPKLDN